MHVYRWDLDKTYLATDIDSVRGLVRAALEAADDKRNVPGAPALWRGLLARDPSARAEVVSGSPTQMRAVLEEKLALDGIRFDALVLKDNLGNIRKGRFRAVRGQLGYKLPHLLSLRLAHPPDTTESLFGDDSEVDALVYAIYAACIRGQASADQLAAVMRAADAYDDQVAHAVEALRRLMTYNRPSGAGVTGIFIHVGRRMPLRHFRHLGGDVRPVFSWFQAALALVHEGRLHLADADAVLADCAAPRDGPTMSPSEIAALVQDAVRRGVVPAIAAVETCAALPTAAPARHLIERSIRHLDGWCAPTPQVAPDWFAFLAAAREE